MAQVERFEISPEFRTDSGLWAMNIDVNSFPYIKGFLVKERELVSIPAGGIGGNHTHPRQELFFGFSTDLTLYWLDEAGEKHHDALYAPERPVMFLIPSMVPHAVFNSGSTAAILLEFSDGPLTDITPLNLVD